jgi:hypothetical protein
MRRITILALTLFLSFFSSKSIEAQEVGISRDISNCGLALFVGLACLEMVTIIYPPVVTNNLLSSHSDGLESCMPSSIYNDTIKDFLKMAYRAFTANAIAVSVGMLSLLASHLTQTPDENRNFTSEALMYAGMISWTAGLGAELAGVIQSQRAYNHLFGSNNKLDYCPKNGNKQQLKTVLGFGYFDLATNGMVGLSGAAALFFGGLGCLNSWFYKN